MLLEFSCFNVFYFIKMYFNEVLYVYDYWLFLIVQGPPEPELVEGVQQKSSLVYFEKYIFFH